MGVRKRHLQKRIYPLAVSFTGFTPARAAACQMATKKERRLSPFDRCVTQRGEKGISRRSEELALPRT
jgi:hypothetical protein